MNFSRITIILLLVSSPFMYSAAADDRKKTLSEQLLTVCRKHPFLGRRKGEARMLLNENADINYYHVEGTPLCYLISAIKKKAENEYLNPLTERRLERSSFSDIIYRSQYLMKNVEFIIDSRADLNNIGDPDSRSALQIACCIAAPPDPELVALLLRSGADLKHKDKYGTCPFDNQFQIRILQGGVPAALDEALKRESARQVDSEGWELITARDLE